MTHIDALEFLERYPGNWKNTNLAGTENSEGSWTQLGAYHSQESSITEKEINTIAEIRNWDPSYMINIPTIRILNRMTSRIQGYLLDGEFKVLHPQTIHPESFRMLCIYIRKIRKQLGIAFGILNENNFWSQRDGVRPGIQICLAGCFAKVVRKSDVTLEEFQIASAKDDEFLNSVWFNRGILI